MLDWISSDISARSSFVPVDPRVDVLYTSYRSVSRRNEMAAVDTHPLGL